MKLTERKKAYLDCIVASMSDSEMAVGVALLTLKEEQEEAMIDFLMQHVQNDRQTLTDEEILEKAIEIHRSVR
ncbi:MAG: hypothetical protein IJD97_10255 [Clostridia bacterium]|nr:hypothetical protein [Clostridia bacterium]